MRAKFGYWRVYDAPNVTRDIEVRRKIFRPCMYAPACLGATTDDESLRGKYWVVLGKYDNLTHVTNNSGTAMAAAGITVSNEVETKMLPTTSDECMSTVFGGHQNKWEDGLCLTDMSFLDLGVLQYTARS